MAATDGQRELTEFTSADADADADVDAEINDNLNAAFEGVLRQQSTGKETLHADAIK